MNYTNKTKEELISELQKLQQEYNSLKETADNEKREHGFLNDKFTSQFDLFPQIIFEYDLTGNLTYLNKPGLDLFGYSQKDLNEGLNLLTGFVPEEWNRLKEMMKRILDGEKLGNVEYTAIRKNGTTFPILTHSTAIYKNNELVGMHGIAIDITDWKQVEEALQESEERFRNLLENNDAVILFVNPVTTRIIFANDSAVKFYGWKKEELLEMTINQINTLPLDEIKLKMAEALKRKQNYFVFKHRLANGSIHDVEVYQSKLLLKNEVIISVIVHDISERVKAEELLKSFEFNFRTFADFTIDWEYWEDENNWIGYMSPSCETMTGYSSEEFVSNPELVNSIVHPDDLNALHYHHEKAYHFQNRNDIDEVEFRVIKKDGSVINIHHTCRPIYNDDGKFVGRRVTNRDVTERKQAERALKESEERYRNLFETAHEGIWSFDSKGLTVLVNDRMAEMLAYRTEDLIGKPITDFMRVEDLADFNRRLMEGRQGKREVLERCFLRSDGSELWTLVSVTPIIDVNGKYVGSFGMITDIGDRKKTEQELIVAKEKAEESDHLKTAFLHNISHEIRTPMNAIIGFSELLNEPNLSTDKREQFTDTIIRSSDQLLHIISDIISIATLESGQEKMYEKEVDLNAVLRSLYEQFLLDLDAQNVSLSLSDHIAYNEVKILADETKLVQILTNLISNALKFTLKGSISYGYKVKENELEFYVEDTGIGISPELHQGIFDRFRQVEGIAQQFGGSGLGLSISKGYVELMGGRMWLISELGKGSTFNFTIPYKKAYKTTPLERDFVNELKIEDNTPKTILVAEDEDSNFMLLKELLSGLNANIIRAVNGVEAVNICKSNPAIDLILMDIKMPVMDGMEATKQIKSFLPNLPIIAQTAYSTEAEVEKILASRCNDFISKPLIRELLLAKIKKQIERA